MYASLIDQDGEILTLSLFEELSPGVRLIALDTKEIVFERETPKVQLKSASKHIEISGLHLQNFLIRNIYSLGFLIMGNYVAIEAIKEDKPTILSSLLYFGSIYNSVYATIEVYRSGKNLVKASRKLRDIEKELFKEDSKWRNI